MSDIREFATCDLERFRAELDINGFRSQLTGVGARDFVRNLMFAADHVTTIVWVRSEPREPDGVPFDITYYNRLQREAE